MTSENEMRRRVWLAVVAVALLVASIAYIRARTNEIKLASQVSDALRSAGFMESIHAISGCTVTLSGSIESEDRRSRAELLVAGVPGICRVENLLEVFAPGGDQMVPGALRISTAGDLVVLQGVVPSRRIEAVLLAAAAERWGPDNMRDELSIDPDIDISGWPVSFVALLDALHGRRQDLDVGLGSGRVEVAGRVVSELERGRVHGAIDAAFPGMPIVNRVVVQSPVDPVEQLQLRLDTYLRAHVVDFNEGGVELTPHGREVLDGVVEILEASEDPIEIAGHMDSTNSNAYNLDLSQRRAESVRGYLALKRISRKRIRTVGYGESRPIARNDTEEGRQRNQRIEIRVLREN